MAALATAAVLVSSAAADRAPSAPSARDSYARIIARADAIVLGRVLEAGVREVADPGTNGRIVTKRGYARIAVQRWILGADADSTLEVTLSPDDAPLRMLQQEALRSTRPVILYLTRSRGEWWVVREFGVLGRPTVGIEVLPAGEIVDRIPAILNEAAASFPDSLAASADLAVVCSLDRLITAAVPCMVCHVERVVFGALTDSVLTVVTQTRGDLRRGKALLLLAARPDSTWEVLEDGAGCYYLDRDRVAHFAAPVETVFSRVAAAHARRAGGTVR